MPTDGLENESSSSLLNNEMKGNGATNFFESSLHFPTGSRQRLTDQPAAASPVVYKSSNTALIFIPRFVNKKMSLIPVLPYSIIYALQTRVVKVFETNTLHAGSAIDADDLAVDPLAVLGSEEANNAGNVDGLADALHGRPGLGVLVDLVVGQLLATRDVLAADGVVHVSLNAAGGDAVDGDLLVAGVDGHAADEGLDGALGARVDGVLGHALGLAGDGAHEDDAAADGQVLVGLAGDEELAAGVDAHDAVVLLLGDVLEVAEGDDAGVGADDVELAEVLDGEVHHLDGLGDVADVGLVGDGVGAHLLDVLDDLVGGVLGVGVVDDDLGAAAGELDGHGGTNATAGASDKGDLAIKTGGVDCRHF